MVGYTGPDPDNLELFVATELLILQQLQNKHMTEEEKKLTSFTRKNLMRLANWPDWQKADDKQLDAHYDAGAIGKAVPQPEKDLNSPSQDFGAVWAQLVKATGT